jgi:hypothetical protein
MCFYCNWWNQMGTTVEHSSCCSIMWRQNICCKHKRRENTGKPTNPSLRTILSLSTKIMLVIFPGDFSANVMSSWTLPRYWIGSDLFQKVTDCHPNVLSVRITLCWTLWEDLFTQNTEENFMLNTGEIYLHKILRNTLCWTPTVFNIKLFLSILCK